MKGLPAALPGQHGAPALRLWSSASAATRMRQAMWWQCIANTCRIQKSGTGAPTTTRSGQPALGQRGRRRRGRSAHVRPPLRTPPGSGSRGDAPQLERDFLDDLNPDSVKLIRAWLEPSLGEVAPESRFQFERHGYFVADRIDSQPGKPVFNRTVTLKDSWARSGRGQTLAQGRTWKPGRAGFPCLRRAGQMARRRAGSDGAHAQRLDGLDVQVGIDRQPFAPGRH